MANEFQDLVYQSNLAEDSTNQLILIISIHFQGTPRPLPSNSELWTPKLNQKTYSPVLRRKCYLINVNNQFRMEMFLKIIGRL